MSMPLRSHFSRGFSAHMWLSVLWIVIVAAILIFSCRSVMEAIRRMFGTQVTEEQITAIVNLAKAFPQE